MGHHERVDIHLGNSSSVVGMVGTPKDAVVTGDAVVLDVQIAQLPVRAVAALIDIVVMLLGYVAGVALWAMTLLQFDTALSAAVLIIYTVLVIVGYPVVFETATRGRTLGKMAMGLRVVSEDGGPERFRQALFRALSGFVEIWMLSGAPAVICSLLSPKGKRIGDIFAGTVVISERGPKLARPGHAAGAGLVGFVAAAVRAAARAGRVGSPIPVPRTRTRTGAARSDGGADRR